MDTRRVFPICCAVALLASGARAECAYQELKGEQRDVSTVQRLEVAWSHAYLRGDTGLESCLLTPDFLEITGNGALHNLSDELALAAKNKGTPESTAPLPPVTVHLHGNVAVAYGTSDSTQRDGKKIKHYFADYYTWDKGEWHVYFSQQTVFPA